MFSPIIVTYIFLHLKTSTPSLTFFSISNHVSAHRNLLSYKNNMPRFIISLPRWHYLCTDLLNFTVRWWWSFNETLLLLYFLPEVLHHPTFTKFFILLDQNAWCVKQVFAIHLRYPLYSKIFSVKWE